VATQQLVRFSGQVQVQWNTLRTASGAYVAVCEPLKLTVQAESWAELMEDIAVTLDLLLKDLLEADANEFTRFLHEHGWVLQGAIPTHSEGIRFDVPFFPVMMGHGSASQLHQ
jgi:hypothetical protein